MVVMIAIENSDGKFLMQKRVPEKGGDYGVTGGHPKSGETPYEGIITEVKEELGIDISKYDITEFDSGCDGKDCYKMYYVKADLDIAYLNIQFIIFNCYTLAHQFYNYIFHITLLLDLYIF